MKKTKLFAAVLSAVTALSPIAYAQTAFALQEPISSGRDTLVLAGMPDWIPKDFDSALSFLNTYGAVHTEDGYICMAVSEWPDPADKERYAVEMEGDGITRLLDTTLTHDTSMEYARNFQIHLAIYHSVTAGEATLRHVDRQAASLRPESEWDKTYHFTVDQKLNVTETDVFAWLPDCIGEYDAFLNKDEETGCVQRVYAANGYILFFLDGSEGTAFNWVGENAPSDTCEQYLTAFCSPVNEMEEPGSPYAQILAFKPVSDGVFRMQFDLTDGRQTLESASANYYITEGGKFILRPDDALIEIRDADSKELLNLDDLLTWEAEEKLEITTNAVYQDPTFGDKDVLIYAGPIFRPESNQYIDNEFGSLFRAERFQYRLLSHDPRYQSPADSSVKALENGAHIVQFFLKYSPSGDVNCDGTLSISDAVAVQKWLAAGESKQLAEWHFADLLHDNQLDARDLSLLLQKLCAHSESDVKCSLTIETVYSGYGIGGDFLGEESFSDNFCVYEGDSFYEKMPCRFQTIPGTNTAPAPSFTVEKIIENGVVISIRMDDRFGETIKKEVAFGETIDGPYPRFPIDDGMNAAYTLTFSKSGTKTDAEK